MKLNFILCQDILLENMWKILLHSIQRKNYHDKLLSMGCLLYKLDESTDVSHVSANGKR